MARLFFGASVGVPERSIELALETLLMAFLPASAELPSRNLCMLSGSGYNPAMRWSRKLFMETNCRAETLYLIAHGLRTRGYFFTQTGDTFAVETGWGHFSLTLMPHNKRVLISHSLFIDPNFRNRGFGQKLHDLREELARESGVNLLLGTVREDNAPQVHIMEKRGWKRFTNRNTGVSLWGKEL